jgi:hypothetical protein
MQRLVKKIDQNFPLHNSAARCEEGGMGCELSELHTNRFGCGARAYSILQTERTMSPTASVCRREETNHLLLPCFCRTFVQPWSALPVHWTDCGKQCHVANTSKVNKEISNLFQHCEFTSFNAELLSSPQPCEIYGSHSGVAEDSGLLRCYAILPGNYFLMFRKMMLPLSGSIGQYMETWVSTYSNCTYRTTQPDFSE